jgi:hypothetical protein
MKKLQWIVIIFTILYFVIGSGEAISDSAKAKIKQRCADKYPGNSQMQGACVNKQMQAAREWHAIMRKLKEFPKQQKIANGALARGYDKKYKVVDWEKVLRETKNRLKPYGIIK